MYTQHFHVDRGTDPAATPQEWPDPVVIDFHHGRPPGFSKK
jgi:hypothetical protein